MNLIINGENKNFPSPLNIEQLLARLKLKPKSVVVELNRKILTADKYVDIQLDDGDTLEIVQFVGGG